VIYAIQGNGNLQKQMTLGLFGVKSVHLTFSTFCFYFFTNMQYSRSHWFYKYFFLCNVKLVAITVIF